METSTTLMLIFLAISLVVSYSLSFLLNDTHLPSLFGEKIKNLFIHETRVIKMVPIFIAFWIILLALMLFI